LAITTVATASVVSGLDKGVKRLSQLNLTAALVLVVFLLVVGGGLTALQSMSIATGLPFAVILLLMASGPLKAFQEEIPAMSHAEAKRHYRDKGSSLVRHGWQLGSEYILAAPTGHLSC